MTRVNVERWRGHLAAAQRRGVTLAQYAREQGLSRHTLYAARQQLQREAAASGRRRRPEAKVVMKQSPFVAVRVTPGAAVVRARLANGVALEFGALAAGDYTALLATLAALPCSN
ncbi:MAG: IS66 family insertion sequence element accessory protein TnpA [Candidatus Methylomirabilales bacterium]